MSGSYQAVRAERWVKTGLEKEGAKVKKIGVGRYKNHLVTK